VTRKTAPVRFLIERIRNQRNPTRMVKLFSNVLKESYEILMVGCATDCVTAFGRTKCPERKRKTWWLGIEKKTTTMFGRTRKGGWRIVQESDSNHHNYLTTEEKRLSLNVGITELNSSLCEPPYTRPVPCERRTPSVSGEAVFNLIGR
jgi:hypothetical protein